VLVLAIEINPPVNESLRENHSKLLAERVLRLKKRTRFLQMKPISYQITIEQEYFLLQKSLCYIPNLSNYRSLLAAFYLRCKIFLFFQK